MEQTLGKRIMLERKRLGLTQEQLAEKLGVTAQAVSKWENDQSCPDITALPRLADIFGISTDALLGRQPEKAAHRAEVVTEDEASEPNGFQADKSGFEFTYDGGKRGTIGFAVLVLSVGILYLADKLLGWDIGFWNILWPTALVVFGIFSLWHKFSLFSSGCVLVGGYFLLTYTDILPFTISGDLILPIIIVMLGVSLLVDALKKPREPMFNFSWHNDGRDGPRNNFSLGENCFTYHASFGEAHQHVALEKLEKGEIHTSFGEFTVDLTGIEAVEPGCCLEAHCSFGELRLRVPRRFQLKPNSSTAFASVEFCGNCDSEPAGTIRLDASVSFGEIGIDYV